MRLLYVSNVPSPYQLEFFRSIAERGLADVRALFCMWTYPGRGWTRPDLPEGFEVLPHVSLQRILPDLVLSFEIEKRIREFRPDVAIVGGYMVPGLHVAMAALTRLGAPWLFWEEFHRFSTNPLKRALRRRLLMGMLRRCSAVLAIGTRAQLMFKGLVGGRKPVYNFPYASDLRRFLAEPQRTKARRLRLLYSGQLIPRKGVDVLLRAFEISVKDHPELELTILGDGPLRGELESSVPSDLQSRVRFEGQVPWKDLPSRYASANVFVMPSNHEGWGLVVPEAMAASLPVISTREVGSALDLVKDGDTGFLVAKNDAQALARHISHFCENPDEIGRMGARAKAAAMHLDVGEAGQRLLEIAGRTHSPVEPGTVRQRKQRGAPCCSICGGSRVILSGNPVRTLLRCKRCRSMERVNCWPVTGAEIRKKMYTSASLLRGRLLGQVRRNTWLKELRRAFVLSQANPGILCEIGPGDGEFAEHILADVKKLLLVEESRNYADALRLRLRSPKVVVLNEDFLNASLPTTVDTIVAFAVLEHVDDPSLFLRKCLKHLMPGGVVVVETPSASSFEARLFGARWNDAKVLDHRHLLAYQGLVELVKRSGAEVVALRSVEPWFAFITCAISAAGDCLKDFLYGRARNARSRIEHAVSAGRRRGDLVRWVMHRLVDLLRPLIVPVCHLLERKGLGKWWYCALRAATPPPTMPTDVRMRSSAKSDVDVGGVP